MSTRSNVAESRKLLAESATAQLQEGEEAWVMIARAQTHATLALVDAVRELADIMRHKR